MFLRRRSVGQIIGLLLVCLLLGGCATIPTEQEILAMSDKEFRLWVRGAVKDLNTGQWVLAGADVIADVITVGTLLFVLPPVVKAAAAKGAASVTSTP